MQTPADLAELLHRLADELAEDTFSDGLRHGVRDLNGNTVGSFVVDYEAELEEDEPPAPDARHLEELEAIGYTETSLEPLLELEDEAHGAAEDYCNVEGFDFDAARAEVEERVAELFGGSLPEGFFVNGDPRGYALKLREGTGALSYRDWGDFEILAPEFS